MADSGPAGLDTSNADMLASDLRGANEDSTLGQAALQLGIVPDMLLAKPRGTFRASPQDPDWLLEQRERRFDRRRVNLARNLDKKHKELKEMGSAMDRRRSESPPFFASFDTSEPMGMPSILTRSFSSLSISSQQTRAESDKKRMEILHLNRKPADLKGIERGQEKIEEKVKAAHTRRKDYIGGYSFINGERERQTRADQQENLARAYRAEHYTAAMVRKRHALIDQRVAERKQALEDTIAAQKLNSQSCSKLRQAVISQSRNHEWQPSLCSFKYETRGADGRPAWCTESGERDDVPPHPWYLPSLNSVPNRRPQTR